MKQNTKRSELYLFVEIQNKACETLESPLNLICKSEMMCRPCPGSLCTVGFLPACTKSVLGMHFESNLLKIQYLKYCASGCQIVFCSYI